MLAFMTFPKDHRTKIHWTNPLERLNKEIERRTNVVGTFPNQDAAIRLNLLKIGYQSPINYERLQPPPDYRSP